MVEFAPGRPLSACQAANSCARRRYGERCDAGAVCELHGARLCWVHAKVLENGMASLADLLRGRPSAPGDHRK